LASRDIYDENGQIIYNVTFMDDPNFFVFAEGVVFLRPKEIIDEISEGSTSVRAKGSLSVCFHPNV
jgi:hypothetical protein